MTDTTPVYGWPYPEPSDARGAGANAIRDLALAVEDVIAASIWSQHAAQFLPADSPSAAPLGGAVVEFGGAPSLMAGFTYDAGQFTYTGPERMFMVAVQAEVENGGTNVGSASSQLYLNVAGADVASSYDELTSIAGGVGTIQTRRHVHTLACPMILATGQVLTVRAYANPAGNVGIAGIRIYPMGSLDG